MVAAAVAATVAATAVVAIAIVVCIIAAVAHGHIGLGFVGCTWGGMFCQHLSEACNSRSSLDL